MTAATKVKDINKQFIKSMKVVSKILDKPPHEITAGQFKTNDPEEITEWDLRKIGGFNAAKNMFFPAEDHNIEVKHGSRLIQTHRNNLEKKYGTDLFFLEELKKTIVKVVTDNKFSLHPAVKVKNPKKKPSKRTLVAQISDTHYGSNISKRELNGLNEFNWLVAGRRTALFIDQICRYKPQYREETDLTICLNGDIIAGQIHNQEWFVDLLTTQFAGTLSILSQAVSYAATQFKSVRVVCQSGNHGRNVGKADKGRATTHKWDSYEHMIYIALREALRSHKNVEFVIPESPYALFYVQGHKFCQTHGDTVINVGNPGNTISMKNINNQVNKINASEISKGEKIAVLLVGHVHTPTVQLMESGCISMINGCLSGTDPFAQSIGIFNSNPTQLMCEVTEEHAVGDIRMVQLKEADTNAELDKIIKPFANNY